MKVFSINAGAMTIVTVKVSAIPAYAKESQSAHAITNNVLVRMIGTHFAHLCEVVKITNSVLVIRTNAH